MTDTNELLRRARRAQRDANRDTETPPGGAQDRERPETPSVSRRQRHLEPAEVSSDDADDALVSAGTLQLLANLVDLTKDAAAWTWDLSRRAVAYLATQTAHLRARVEQRRAERQDRTASPQRQAPLEGLTGADVRAALDGPADKAADAAPIIKLGAAEGFLTKKRYSYAPDEGVDEGVALGLTDFEWSKETLVFGETSTGMTSNTHRPTAVEWVEQQGEKDSPAANDTILLKTPPDQAVVGHIASDVRTARGDATTAMATRRGTRDEAIHRIRVAFVVACLLAVAMGGVWWWKHGTPATTPDASTVAAPESEATAAPMVVAPPTPELPVATPPAAASDAPAPAVETVIAPAPPAAPAEAPTIIEVRPPAPRAPAARTATPKPAAPAPKEDWQDEAQQEMDAWAEQMGLERAERLP